LFNLVDNCIWFINLNTFIWYKLSLDIKLPKLTYFHASAYNCLNGDLYIHAGCTRNRQNNDIIRINDLYKISFKINKLELLCFYKLIYLFKNNLTQLYKLNLPEHLINKLN
jgi:hypothetical protein